MIREIGGGEAEGVVWDGNYDEVEEEKQVVSASGALH